MKHHKKQSIWNKIGKATKSTGKEILKDTKSVAKTVNKDTQSVAKFVGKNVSKELDTVNKVANNVSNPFLLIAVVIGAVIVLPKIMKK